MPLSSLACILSQQRAGSGKATMKGISPRLAEHRQRGGVAIEFALTFPILLALFYAILSYGMIFLVRMGLQHAAEDGVRAALRYQTVTYTAGSTQQQREQQQLQARLVAAQSTATTQAAWIKIGSTAATVAAKVCVIGSNSVGSDCPGYTGVMPSCGTDLDSSCQVVVTVSYNYAAAPFIPSLPGFNLLVPTTLRGQARVLVDGRSFST